MKIYKYPFAVNDTAAIAMPLGACILSLQVQHGVPCLWALVDPEQPVETRSFRIFGTGEEIDIDIPVVTRSRYIGTFQLLGGDFIWHMFEV